MSQKICPLMGSIALCKECEFSVKVMSDKKLRQELQQDITAKERQYTCSIRVLAMGVLKAMPGLASMVCVSRSGFLEADQSSKKKSDVFLPLNEDEYRALSIRGKADYCDAKAAFETEHGKLTDKMVRKLRKVAGKK